MKSPTPSPSPAAKAGFGRKVARFFKITLAALVAAGVLAVIGFVVVVRANRGTFRPCHPGTLRFALCQNASRVGDIRHNILAALDLAEEASRHGADFIVFPEFSFTAVHDIRRGWAWENIAEKPELQGRLSSFARRHGCYLLYNHPYTFGEKRQHHYNETTLMGPDGMVVTNYQKHIPALLDQRCNLGPGPGPVIARLPFGDIGLMVCRDTTQPLRFAEYKDTDLVVAQFAVISHWGPTLQPPGLRMRPDEARHAFFDAIPNLVSAFHRPILMVNKTGLEDEFVYLGGSIAVDEAGERVAQANNGEEILYVDFALDENGRIDGSRPAEPEFPSDRPLDGSAKKFRQGLRRLAAAIP